MGRVLGFIAVVMTVAGGGYLFTRQAESVTSAGSNPQTSIEVTAVRNDLLAIANAERRYFASNGKYGSLGELRDGGNIIPNRPNYSYSAQTTETTFTIIADYSGTDARAPKRLTIDHNMSMTTD
jgi:hypothetical protein